VGAALTLNFVVTERITEKTMNFMLTIVTNRNFKEEDFYWLRSFGRAFQSAGNIAEHLNANSFDIWICGSDNLREFEKSATIGLMEISKSAMVLKVSGYFKVGLFLDASLRAESFELSRDVLSAIGGLEMDLRFLYYHR
jgi:hypothetical protein